MNREAASGRLFFYRAKVKKHGPALGWGLLGRTVPGLHCVSLEKRASRQNFPVFSAKNFTRIQRLTMWKPSSI
jgi:hypothetical protein